jgi:hypothetical protein
MGIKMRLPGQFSDLDLVASRVNIADTEAELTTSRAQDRIDGTLWLALDTNSIWQWDEASAANAAWSGIIAPTDVGAGAGRFLARSYTVSATLVNGTVTVANARVKATSFIVPVHNVIGGTALGVLTVPTASINAGAGTFVINSNNAAGLVDDDSTLRVHVVV